MKRVSILVRGPLFLVAVLGICIGATRLAHPPATTTAAEAVAKITVTAKDNHAAKDPSGSIRLRLVSARALSGRGASETTIEASFKVSLHVPAGVLHRFVPALTPGQFLAVLDNGSSYAGIAPPNAGPLTSGGGIIDFRIPGQPRSVAIVWNDGGQVIPPAQLALLVLR